MPLKCPPEKDGKLLGTSTSLRLRPALQATHAHSSAKDRALIRHLEDDGTRCSARQRRQLVEHALAALAEPRVALDDAAVAAHADGADGGGRQPVRRVVQRPQRVDAGRQQRCSPLCHQPARRLHEAQV